MTSAPGTRQVHTYCSLCGVGCPSVIETQGDRVVSLAPDRTHPRGGLTCAKGRAVPELHAHPHRIDHPMRRTRPKTSDDPGWERCTWDEALDLTAQSLLRIQQESGPHAVVVGRGTAGGTGLGPAEQWVKRLADAFGTPNFMTNTHLCNWARDGAAYYTFGTYPLPPPDVESSGCILVWGANPIATRVDLAAAITDAVGRGAHLVVVDPRRTGLAGRADVLLQPRPGTDAALALALVDVLIDNDWYDEAFVREWTNAPLLVREDDGRLLAAADVAPGTLEALEAAAGTGFVGADDSRDRLVEYRPDAGAYAAATGNLALRRALTVPLANGGHVRCRTVLDTLAEQAQRCRPEIAEQITGVPAAQIRQVARLITEHRPLSHHVWNGIVQHTNATQAGRAIEVLYALVGDYDRRGGNVLSPPVRTNRVADAIPLPGGVADLRLGRGERPLGPPAVPGNVASFDVYSAILDGQPYRVRAMLSFGGNVLLNSGDPRRGREALQQLEFFAQADLFHTPTNQFADVVFPATSFLENDVLMVTTSGWAERRVRAVEPLHERRSDVEIVFGLATRLGLSDRFAGGDVAAAYDEVLAPAGLSWEELGQHPEGVRVAADRRYERHREELRGAPAGFPTPSRKVELFSDRFAEAGLPGAPSYEEPMESPARTPELARAFPLVLTNGKVGRYLHSQHRGLASLRRRSLDPTVELHPDTAASSGVEDREWVFIETPRARVRARVRVTSDIRAGVASATHGWWEACEELGLDPLDPFSEDGANVNLLVHNDVHDPVSGGVPNRSSLCRVRPVGDSED